MTEQEIRRQIEYIQVSEAEPYIKALAIQELEGRLVNPHAKIKKEIFDAEADTNDVFD